MRLANDGMKRCSNCGDWYHMDRCCCHHCNGDYTNEQQETKEVVTVNERICANCEHFNGYIEPPECNEHGVEVDALSICKDFAEWHNLTTDSGDSAISRENKKLKEALKEIKEFTECDYAFSVADKALEEK